MAYLMCYLDALVLMAFTTSFMWLKIFVQNVIGTGGSRHVAAEDKAVPGANVPEVTDGGNQKPDEEFTTKHRWGNINENDKENFPYTLFVLWALFIVAYVGSSVTEDARPAFDVLFIGGLLWLVCRVVHTICYRFALQPFRSIFWAVGQLTALAMALMLVIAAFQVRFSDEGSDTCEAWGNM